MLTGVKNGTNVEPFYAIGTKWIVPDSNQYLAP